MVQSKSEKERQKIINDKCQALIEALLKSEDNKYCVDCDAKGPRWASWNLGILLCIRCAGIHRNLGVHISKVKSVNLDSWSPEHVAYVQRMGNSRARAIYEANLPDDFRRPQTDATLESFIRAKYELKKYIAQDWVDPGPPAPAFNAEEELKKIKEQKRSKMSSASGKLVLSSDLLSSSNSHNHNSNKKSTTANAILGLHSSSKERVKPSSSSNNIIDISKITVNAQPLTSLPKKESSADWMQELSGASESFSKLDLVDDIFQANSSPATTTTTNIAKPPPSLDTADLLGTTNLPTPTLASTQLTTTTANIDSSFSSGTSNLNLSGQQQTPSDQSKKILSKESILSLYSFSNTSSQSMNFANIDPFGMKNNNTNNNNPLSAIPSSTLINQQQQQYQKPILTSSIQSTSIKQGSSLFDYKK